MKTVAKKNLYEGMFLVDSAEAGTDWDGVIAGITRILEKAKAEIVSIRKWDDRRLAYDIRGVSRGTYILAYFRVEGDKVQEIEKSVQLSERIMRVLILNAEGMSAEDIEKETPAARAEKEGLQEGYRRDEDVREDRSDEPRRYATGQVDEVDGSEEEDTDDEQESDSETPADN